MAFGIDLADAVDHAGDLLDVRLLGLDPQQVGAVLQRGDAVEHAAVLAGAGAELEQVATAGASGRSSLPSRLIMTSPFFRSAGAISSQSRKLLYWSPRSPGVVADGDLLGQAGAQGVGAGDDDAVVDAQFQEGVAAGADLGEEVLVRHGDLAVLVAALLLVGDLVLDLQRAGAGLDHLLGQQIGRLGVAEAGVDVGDDRHDVGLVVVDRVEQLLLP